MNRIIRIYIWLIGSLLSICVQSMGQEMLHRITGTLVSDDQNLPMEFAEILVSDSLNNAIASVLTDEKGTFSMELSEGTYVFRFRELGKTLKQDTVALKNYRRVL